MAEKKILIVDYDMKSLDSLAELFEKLGVQVIKARDGVSAYEKYREEAPDLVILEAMLPKLHGFDLTEKIVQDSRGTVPVIIVTGVYKGHQHRNEALRTLGATDYFEKPYDKTKLLERVRGLIMDEAEVEEEIPDLPDLPGADSVIKNLAERLKKSDRDKSDKKK